MIIVNIYEAKAKLSEYLDAVGRGERVLICKRNQPVAELRPVAAARTEPRPFGDIDDRFEVPASFFDPLPDEEIDPFNSASPIPGITNVAERSDRPYKNKRPSRKNRR